MTTTSSESFLSSASITNSILSALLESKPIIKVKRGPNGRIIVRGLDHTTALEIVKGCIVTFNVNGKLKIQDIRKVASTYGVCESQAAQCIKDWMSEVNLIQCEHRIGKKQYGRIKSFNI